MKKVWRKCNTCGIEATGSFEDALKLFHRSRKSPNGLYCTCKVCKKKYQQQWQPDYEKKRAASRRKDYKMTSRKAAQRKYAGRNFQCSVVECENGDIQLHHISYDKPLEVVPLCTQHHKMVHDKLA